MTRPLDYLPFVGEPVVRRRLNEIFSRQMLGAVFVGAAAAKIIEKLIDLVYVDALGQLFAWSVTFVLAVVLFVWWEHLERAASDLAEGVASEEDTTVVSAMETAKEAFEEAEEARGVAERAESVAEAADTHAAEAAEAALEADDRAAAAAADAKAAEKRAREAAKAVEDAESVDPTAEPVEEERRT